MLASHPWADAIRSRPNVRIFLIDPTNRDLTAGLIVERLRSLLNKPIFGKA
jgi:nucleoside-triphosphatase THEP1